MAQSDEPSRDADPIPRDLIFRALHDLQAPSRHVRSFLSMFRSSIDESTLSADSIELLDAATRATDEFRNRYDSIRSVLAVPLKPRRLLPVDLVMVTQAAWAGIVKTTNCDDVQFVIEGAATIESDESMIESLITELLDNSRRFRKPSEPLRIQCTVESFVDSAEIAISDNGVGIDVDRVDDLIEPFYRGQHHDGLGLGLSRCQCIAKATGCDLRFESDGVSGTTVIVSLPLQQSMT